MDYIGYLVFIVMFVLTEAKYDEQIRSLIDDHFVGNKLIHSKWQLAMRGILIMAIIWAQDGGKGTMEIFIATFCMYTFFYWWFFDTIAALSLHKPPWYLGTTSKVDKKFPGSLHIAVWIVKLGAAAISIYYVIRFL